MSKTATTSAIDAILKKYGNDSILLGNNVVDVKRISTGSLTLDLITGGGWPVGRIIEVYGPESSGKAQPLYSKILTPTGWKTMGEMEIGTEVTIPNGGVAQVTGIFPQGPQEVYEITTESGKTARCTSDHLWRIKSSFGASSSPFVSVVSTEFIMVFRTDVNESVFINVSTPGETLQNDLETWEKIVDISNLGVKEECQCIMIDSEDHLYITDNNIITHNTSLAIHSMIEAQKAYPEKKILIIDTEHALDRRYCEKLGLDMSQVYVTQPNHGEQALDIAEDLIRTGEFSFVLVDSVATLIPKSELEGEMEDSAMGSQARLMSKGLRKLTGITNTTNTILFFTNQLRSKIGVVYGNPEVTSGGNALKFYASIRVDIRKKAGDKIDGEIRNITTTCKTVKNKTAPPFRTCSFDINFGEGIDRTGEIIAVGITLGIIEKNGNTLSYDGTKLGVGQKQAKATLLDNPDLADIISASIMQHQHKDIDHIEAGLED